MSYQPHYIANYEPDSGLFTYTEPFLAPEKAFPMLQDAYCWRGRVKKREGNKLLGQLRHKLTTASIGNISSATTTINLFTVLGINATEPNAQIAPGSVPFPISIAIGVPISRTLTDSTGTGTMTIAPAGVITSAVINYATGVLTLVFSGVIGASAATITMWYYPGLPVMGIRTQESSTEDFLNTIFFDTKYAYQFNSLTNEFDDLPSTTPTTWNGFDYNLFWTTTYGSNTNGDLFWATNDNMLGATQDPIRFYDTTTWADYSPPVDGVNFLFNALIILPYKDRLVMMNTWEGALITTATQNPQRIRWSWNGDVLHKTGGVYDAFRSDQVGHGGYLGAPTNEAIIGAEFIKDTLVVKFERSSWKLVYTGNEVLPFVFQKINTVMGSESTFSLVPFDRGIYTISNVGVTTDDSVNVERIDMSIPQTIFDFSVENEGLERIYGIRDYVNELVYWTYVDQDASSVFPNQVLVYNYRNNTYAIFNDSFTCYGYFQEQEASWAQLTFENWGEWTTSWSDGAPDTVIPDVIAGNQQGFVALIAQQTTNDPSLYISAIDPATSQITSPNHNLFDDDIIQLTGIIGTLSVLNGNTYKVSLLTGSGDIFILMSYVGGLWVTATLPPGTYLGGGQIARWNSFTIATKVFAPFYDAGSQCRLGYVDYLFDRTDNGQITSQIYVNENNTISMSDPVTNTALMGSNIVNTCPENLTLLPFQANQDKIWHRQFVQTIAQNFQIQLTIAPEQLINSDIASSDFIMHAMALYLSKNARMTP